MSKAKSPQEKKALSLKRDRRNDYGENAKSSRKNIPKSKRHGLQAERRAANVPLNMLNGSVSEEEAIQAEVQSRANQLSKRLASFAQSPDTPLGEVLKGKAARRAITAQFGKTNPQGLKWVPAQFKTQESGAE
jgi:hypothetical protein